MANENLLLHLQGMEAMFNQQMKPFLLPLAITEEGSKAFRRLLLSEAIDFIAVDETDMMAALGRYKVPAHIFSEYFDLSTGVNQLRGFVAVGSITLRSLLLNVRKLDPRATYYYRNSISYDYVTVGVEVYDISQLRNTLKEFSSPDQMNLQKLGD
jgi:hypothetical protein